MDSPKWHSDEEQLLLRQPRRPAFLPCCRSTATKRRRPATVRLGKRRGWLRRGGRLLFGVLRRIRFRYLVVKYRKLVKKIGDASAGLLKDLAEGSATMEAAQARMLMETYFAVPIMPLQLTTHAYMR